MKYTLLSLLALLSQSIAAPVVERQAANPTVTISDGSVVGTATGVLNQPSVTKQVNAYLGIPFAESPPLRFAPPTPPKPWSTPLIAQTLPPACLQQFLSGVDGEREKLYFNNPGYAPPAESEDCLYLNVFSPPDASPTNLKSVMFWIFGGNNQFGTASLAYYNGSSLAANEDVVVVAINYRTNMFGFSNSPQIPFGKQNSGYLDQRLALQWVQNNIKQFGGDPSKVTIFGESAGGNNAKELLANPPSPLPFRAAILQSQALTRTGSGRESYDRVLANFGCSLNIDPLSCIRKVPGTDILAYITDNGLSFPDVTGDGTSSGANTLPDILSGKFANVPILIGTNKDEGRVFADILGVGPDLQILNDTLAPLGVDPELVLGPLLKTYPSNIGNDTFLLTSQVLTDAFFTCPASSLSNALKSAGRTIWRYRYDAAFPILEFGRDLGAYHSSEIPSVWGTYPTDNQYAKLTQTEIDLSTYMQGVWAGFAKNPGAGPGWPKLGSNGGKELGILGGANAPTGEETVPLLVADAPCAVLTPVEIAAGLAF